MTAPSPPEPLTHSHDGVHPLPPPDALVGRRDEIVAVVERLRDPAVRLLTLTGPGGVGKTRLALAVVAASSDDPGIAGAAPVVVSLAAVTDPGLVVPAIARALGVREDGAGPVELRLAAHLAGGPRLLILDNLEQVSAAGPAVAALAAGPAVAALAAACPALTVLVTSRSRLDVRGEHEFPVPPLPLPDVPTSGTPDVTAIAATDAVTLFVRRARAANPDFALTAGNALAVAELCRRLDGLPLALELAAARCRVLSPEAMLARSSGRLSLLSAGPVDSPERHRSVERAVTWSHDLLSAADRALFRRVSVFVGAFEVDAAEAVASVADADGSAVVDGLTRLLEANLLSRVGSDTGEVRLRMLETVREVARAKLEAAGETDEVAERHAGWYRDLVVAAEPVMHGEEQGRWFVRLVEDHDDLRAAIDWALAAGRGELALRLIAGPLWYLWAMRGWVRQERHRLDQALALIGPDHGPAPPALVAKARFDDALYFLQTGDYPAARERLLWVLAHMRGMGEPGRNGVAGVLGNLATLDMDQGDHATARARLAEALAIRREIGEPGAVGRTLINLGGVASREGDHAVAIALLDEALTLCRRTGDRRSMAYCLINLGESSAGQGHDARALAFFDQALGLLRHAGDINGEGVALVNLAAAALRLGDPRRAAAALAEALQQHRELHTPIVVADALEVAAEVALAAGRPALVPRFLTVATTVRTTAATVPTPLVRRRLERATSAAHLALGRAAFEEATIAGRALTVVAAIDQAIAVLTETIAGSGGLTVLRSPGEAPGEPRGGRRSPVAAPGGAELSRRQREVLRLLVDGLTDPEIGEVLGVGARTVESHVSAILTKLGVHARTAAVAHAVRHGLA